MPWNNEQAMLKRAMFRLPAEDISSEMENSKQNFRNGKNHYLIRH
jgi:hypothetical protein